MKPFMSGRIVVTVDAALRLTSDDVREALHRHLGGDWGHADEAQCEQNRIAFSERRHPITSVFYSIEGVEFLVITEPDGMCTLIKLVQDRLKRAG